jgi:hypothetical protein
MPSPGPAYVAFRLRQGNTPTNVFFGFSQTPTSPAQPPTPLPAGSLAGAVFHLTVRKPGSSPILDLTSGASQFIITDDGVRTGIQPKVLTGITDPPTTVAWAIGDYDIQLDATWNDGTRDTTHIGTLQVFPSDVAVP